ncbi:hypothetical protein RRSWK_03033 [Rhodopirellula sp. SWK7]|nr:hypothetical protein RRSWK_03033 [Rhodopirellula sp. SWK7]
MLLIAESKTTDEVLTRESFLRVFQFHYNDLAIAGGTRTRKSRRPQKPMYFKSAVSRVLGSRES